MIKLTMSVREHCFKHNLHTSSRCSIREPAWISPSSAHPDMNVPPRLLSILWHIINTLYITHRDTRRHISSRYETVCADGRVLDEIRKRVPDCGTGDWKGTAAINTLHITQRCTMSHQFTIWSRWWQIFTLQGHHHHHHSITTAIKNCSSLYSFTCHLKSHLIAQLINN